MGAFDIEAGRPARFLDRVQSAYLELTDPGGSAESDTDVTLLLASAYAVNGKQDMADRLAQLVIDRVGRPRAYQHLSIAAAHALRRDTAAALQELRDSPPGWVRQRAALLPRDPRFITLWDLPQFRDLVDAHKAALARQRDAYLFQTVAIDTRRDRS